MNRTVDGPSGRGWGSRFWLTVKSVVVLAWFTLWFFICFPVAVLWLSRHDGAVAASPATLLGACMIAGAVLIVVLPTVAFVRHARGTPFPWDPPRAFVSGGLYRWVRNPMYLAYLTIIIGEAIIFASAALGGYALGFAGLAHFYVTRFEERDLLRRYGDTYRHYCETVPRWIPRRPA